MNGHRLRYVVRAGGGQVNPMAAAARLFRTDPPDARPKPHVVVLDDVTKGLGIRNSDEVRVLRLVQEAETARDLLTARATVLPALRAIKSIPADTRAEVVRRAAEWWKRGGMVATPQIANTLPPGTLLRAERGPEAVDPDIYESPAKKKKREKREREEAQLRRDATRPTPHGTPLYITRTR